MKKIAILISGNLDNNINEEKINYGYSLSKVINALRCQFEDDYDVNYFCVFNQDFDKKLFRGKLIDYLIKSDEDIIIENKEIFKNTKIKRFDLQFCRRKYLKTFVQKHRVNYDFYIYLRNDSILVPNGNGLKNNDRNISSNYYGYKRMHQIDPKYYLKKFKLKDNFNDFFIYRIAYTYGNDNDIHNGFCLTNWKGMICFLDFVYSKAIYKYNIRGERMPERIQAIYLKKKYPLLKIKNVEDILESNSKDKDKFNYLSIPRFVK